MDTGLVQSGLVWLLLKLSTTLEWSRGPAIHPPSSSRVALNVIFNFIPKVLLEEAQARLPQAWQGWMGSRGNLLLGPCSDTGRARLPARGRPTALPEGTESLQRGVCAPQESSLGNEVGKEFAITSYQLRYTQTA